MEEERTDDKEALDQPLDRMIEQPDLDALRDSYKGPSRSRMRVERFVGALRRALDNRTILTFVLAGAIVIVLVVGYLQLT